MVRIPKKRAKQREKLQIIPDLNLVRVLDRDLQKQLDDLNDMRKLKHDIPKSGGDRHAKS